LNKFKGGAVLGDTVRRGNDKRKTNECKITAGVALFVQGKRITLEMRGVNWPRTCQKTTQVSGMASVASGSREEKKIRHKAIELGRNWGKYTVKRKKGKRVRSMGMRFQGSG